ncbi:hypothetical protein D3C81_1289690 [compost metagenome]
MLRTCSRVGNSNDSEIIVTVMLRSIFELMDKKIVVIVVIDRSLQRSSLVTIALSVLLLIL